MKSYELKKIFLDYFKELDHKIIPSSPLLCEDKSLLFTTAGMVQFKPLFLGTVEPLPYTRAASSQRCLRTTDLQQIGKTGRHLTYFEMLGNFSFGDYFKKEAILWAYTFLTKKLHIPEDKLWVSIYKYDDEAYDIWKDYIKFPKDKIVKRGKEDNFWQMGPTGPCGPCSEIIIDLGEERGCRRPNCNIDCDCDRFLELWNLVFTEYSLEEDGKLRHLPRKNIDTGMGLERLCSVMQDVPSNFQTDTLNPILLELKTMLPKAEVEDEKKILPYLYKITDHIRASTFLIYEGLLPTNQERGYVLRSLLRKAIVSAKQINIALPALYKLVYKVAEANLTEGLSDNPSVISWISNIIKSEEENYIDTLDRGYPLLVRLIEKYKDDKIIPANYIFKLYDTYGFPLDLAEELIKDAGLGINKKELAELIHKHKLISKTSDSFSTSTKLPQEKDYISQIKTPFIGYNTLSLTTQIVEVLNSDKKLVSELSEEESGYIIPEVSVFYPEGGGQVGDTGKITNDELSLVVLDTIKINSSILCKILVKKGKVRKGLFINCQVDIERRKAIEKNHTATHLLHAALREVLGRTVKQFGSLVTPDYLRFDFTHIKPLTTSEISQIEERINKKIKEDIEVVIEEMPFEEAKKQGAIALFTDTYKDIVRVVSIDNFSKELCGGCHIKHTSSIGLFKIIKEEGIAKGVRRIEAITSTAILKYLYQLQDIVIQSNLLLKTDTANIVSRIKQLIDELKEKDKITHNLTKNLLAYEAEKIISCEKINIGHVNLIVKEIAKEYDIGLCADILVNKLKQNSIVILLSVSEGKKLSLVCKITKDLINKLNAAEIIKKIVEISGGGGGGREEFARAGGGDARKLGETIKFAKQFIQEKITSWL